MKLDRSASLMDPASLRLSLIPLIDVILFLLIYFVIAGSLAAEEGRLASALHAGSGSGSGQLDFQPQFLDVEEQDGRPVFRLGESRFHDRAALLASLQGLPLEVGITVRVSDRASVGAVAAASQTCRDAGFQKLRYLPATGP